MLRYVRNQPLSFSSQGMLIQHEGQCYYPCIHHTAVGQDRAIGQAETFRAYQQRLRLEAAKTLLRATALRCHEVAVRCGYENIQFFHRLFKRTTGLTPGQYRKQSTGVEA